MDLLTHLYKTYAIIYNAELLAKNKHFCEAYAPTDPTKVVWCQINDAVAYVDSVFTP